MAEQSKAARHVAVIGAGIVGISCAIHLQRKGFRVTLIDADAPGQQTSRGNAGVISAGAMVSMNTPRVLRNLPKYAMGRSSAVRYDVKYLLQNIGWITRFLLGAREPKARETARKLSALTLKSRAEHLALMDDAGISNRFRDTGWLKLYRRTNGADSISFEADVFDTHGVANQRLSKDDVNDLEPCLKPVFQGGLWIKDAHTVDDPGRVATAYAELFAREGGEIKLGKVRAVEPLRAGYKITLDDDTLEVDLAVVASGPWSLDLLKPLGYRFPMAWERGYHIHFQAEDGAYLNRPMHDLDGGYALISMERGMRVTTGVELSHRDNPPTPVQLERVMPFVRQAFPLADTPLDNRPWNGSRPSMADSMPVIGEAPSHRGLWLAFGHAHIGFGTGPITGRLIAEMMNGEEPFIDASYFSPSRFQ